MVELSYQPEQLFGPNRPSGLIAHSPANTFRSETVGEQQMIHRASTYMG